MSLSKLYSITTHIFFISQLKPIKNKFCIHFALVSCYCYSLNRIGHPLQCKMLKNTSFYKCYAIRFTTFYCAPAFVKRMNSYSYKTMLILILYYVRPCDNSKNTMANNSIIYSFFAFLHILFQIINYKCIYSILTLEELIA